MRNPGRSACTGTGIHGPPHAINHLREVLLGYHSVLLFFEAVLYCYPFRLLDDVGDIIVTPIGYGGAKIGKVHGSGQYLSLAYGQGNDGGGIPSAFPVCLIVSL